MLTNKAESPTSNKLFANREMTSVSDPFHRYQQPSIHGLPPEVLHTVFLPFAGDYKDLICFRMVCKYWKEVIDSIPELWNTTGSHLHPELQAMIIRNSRNQLLKVEYLELDWENDPGKEDKMAAFACLMKPSTSRWQELVYYPADDSESATWLFSLPLHNLKRIEIDGLNSSGQRLILDAPKISYIHICVFSLNLISLSGLQYLYLESTDSTLNELTVVLMGSPGLRHLSLRQMPLRIGTEGLPKSYTSKIRLSQLLSLSISGALAHSSTLLLDWIEAPSLEVLYAQVDDPTDGTAHAQLCETVGRHLSAFPLPNKQKARFSIQIMPPEIALYLGDRYIKITNFTWTGANGTQAMLASIASAIEHIDSRTCNEITTLRISCQNHNGCGECLRIVHLHFPRIGHIFVKDGGTHDYHVVPAIQLLSLPSQLGTTEGWLLPKLAKLDLCLRGSTSTDIGNRIVELVKRRKEAEEMVDITELRIKVGFGEIDPNAVEILSQSVTHFEFVSSS